MYWYIVAVTPIQYLFTGRTSKEIAASIEAAINAGEAAPSTRLPSVRALAAELDVAPGTVATAYQTLRSRGLIETGGRNGYTVCARPARLTMRSRHSPVPAGVTDLSHGQPDPDVLPSLSLASLVAGSRPAPAPEVGALPELLDLARRRLEADGVPADFLTLTSGGLDAMERVVATHLRAGDLVAVEDPGWPNVLDLVAAAGLRVLPLELDAEGPVPRSVREALTRGARAVIVTSRAQNPTGCDITPSRAAELRLVLGDFPQTLVIEDDHAAELVATPLAGLAGSTDLWVHVRSTSKPYGADLRLAVVAGDATTIARVEGRMRVGAGWVSTLLQQLVAELWTSPDTAAVVAAAGAEYDARRSQLRQALAERGIETVGASGLNVWVPVHDETTTVTRLLHAGWAVAPGARFRQQSAPAIRVTVSGLTTDTIPTLADDIAVALDDDLSRPLSS